MLNIDFDIQNIKTQLKTLDFQLDNILNIYNNMMPNLNVREQMQNLGIQMINLGIITINKAIKIPNFGTDNSFLNQQITSIKMELQNFQMQLNNNMGMMNNNLGMMNNNFGMMMDNNMFKEEFDENNKNKMNITFKTTQDVRTNLFINKGTSIAELIKTYFREVNHLELFNSDKIKFIFNASQLEYNDNNTKIEDYFHNYSSVIVCDFSGLLS